MWDVMLGKWRTVGSDDSSSATSEDVATFRTAEAEGMGFATVEGTPVTAEELREMQAPKTSQRDLELIEVELPTETVQQLQALATLSRRSVAEEWNAAASFWVFARRVVSEGGTILVRAKSGKIGPVDLQGGER